MTINGKVDRLMAMVAVDQAALDQLAQQFEDVKTALSDEISKIPTEQLPGGSLDGLNSALSDLQGLQVPGANPPSAAAPAAPADAASAPTDTSTPPADTGAPTDTSTPDAPPSLPNG